MYHIGICDDGKNTCSSLEEMILEYTEEKGILTEVKVWYSGESLCDYLKQGGHIDILFLDIELKEPDPNGGKRPPQASAPDTACQAAPPSDSQRMPPSDWTPCETAWSWPGA